MPVPWADYPRGVWRPIRAVPGRLGGEANGSDRMAGVRFTPRQGLHTSYRPREYPDDHTMCSPGRSSGRYRASGLRATIQEAMSVDGYASVLFRDEHARGYKPSEEEVRRRQAGGA